MSDGSERAYGVRTWASLSQVPVGTSVWRQVQLMRELVDERIEASAFAHDWLAARRKSLSDGERVREQFDDLLNQVFFMLDDYAVDPLLRERGDMTENDLAQGVTRVLRELERLR